MFLDGFLRGQPANLDMQLKSDPTSRNRAPPCFGIDIIEDFIALASLAQELTQFFG